LNDIYIVWENSYNMVRWFPSVLPHSCIFTDWTPFLAQSTSKVILRDVNNIHSSGGGGDGIDNE